MVVFVSTFPTVFLLLMTLFNSLKVLSECMDGGTQTHPFNALRNDLLWSVRNKTSIKAAMSSFCSGIPNKLCIKMFLCWIPTREKSNQELQWSFAFYQYLMNFRSGFSVSPGLVWSLLPSPSGNLVVCSTGPCMGVVALTSSHCIPLLSLLLSGSGCGSQSPGCTPNQHLFSREQDQLVFRQFAKIKEKMGTF